MARLDSKFFVPFPEFFRNKHYDLETYMGINFEHKNMPVSVNIIFTRSENLEEIKKAAKKDFEESADMNLPWNIKSAIQKNYERLCNAEPKEPTVKIEFKEGKESWSFDKETETLALFVESDILPDTKKGFFYPADV